MLVKKYDYENARYPVSIEKWVKTKDGVKLLVSDHYGGGFPIEIAAVSDAAVRIRIAKDEFKPPFYDYINQDFLERRRAEKSWETEVKEDKTEISISTGSMTVQIGKGPFSFSVENGKGKAVYEEQLEDVDSVAEGYNRIMPMGYVGDAQGKYGCNVCAKLRHQEHIFGLGERFTEFDRRGQTVRMWNQDTLGCRDEQSYKNIPFYLSSEGYGLFVNSPADVRFHIGTESIASLSIHAEGESLEYYLLTGETLKEIVRTYTNLTGPAAMPPDWSFGLWYSVGFKGTDQEMVEKDAREFRDLHVPCDVFHFDCYWLREDMWCDFIWDDAMYPRRREMFKKLKESHYKICLWINPYVTVKTEMYQEGSKKGYFVKDSKGEVYLADLWHGLLSMCAMLDVTNPQAVAWFQGKLENVLQEGVDVLKTDFGEDIPEDSVFFNGMTGRQMRNVYSTIYNRIVFETTNRVNREGIVWARSGSAGMQKYPVCWSGDPRSCYEGMAGVLKSGLSIGLSGVPFWSHDMGGFYGKVSDEVFVRWCQFGLFSSHSRLHGTSPRQPWAYSQETYAIIKDFICLRYRLMPYILQTARDCAKRGEPFIRPLFLETEDPAAAVIWDEYYFGEKILAAPVFGGHMAERDVYLPGGRWKDLLKGTEYEGGRWHHFVCPLDYMPVFIEADADIPMNSQAVEYLEKE